jgi:hypothetical protein
MKIMPFILPLIIISTAFSQTKTEKIYKLLDLMGSDKSITVMKTQMTEILKNASPSVPTALLDTLFAKMNKEGLYSLTAKIYDKNLDEETIDGLIAFYKTKAGKTFVSKMPVIMQESMQAGAAWGQQIMLEAIQKLKERGYEVQGI